MDMDFSREDFAANKTLAGVGYLVFFVPLIWCRKSRLGRYCANQGLLLMIVQLLLNIFFNILGGIPLLGWLFLLIGRLVSLGVLVVSLLCMLQVIFNERVIELPFIGAFRILPQIRED